MPGLIVTSVPRHFTGTGLLPACVLIPSLSCGRAQWTRVAHLIFCGARKGDNGWSPERAIRPTGEGREAHENRPLLLLRRMARAGPAPRVVEDRAGVLVVVGKVFGKGRAALLYAWK